MVKIPLKFPWIRIQIRITAKIQRFIPWPICHLSTEFCENRLSSFCVILITNKRTNEHGNKVQNITSLAEVMRISAVMMATTTCLQPHTASLVVYTCLRGNFLYSLSLYLSVCLSVWLSLSLSLSPSIHLSIYLSISYTEPVTADVARNALWSLICLQIADV